MSSKKAASDAAARRPSRDDSTAGQTQHVKTEKPSTGSDETLDALLDGRVRLYQSRTGYRVSLDAVLLAWFAKPRRFERVIDLGAGNGAIPLMLASRYRPRFIVGLEVQLGMAARAGRNVRLNALEDSVAILCADVRDATRTFKPATFSLVISNPPFRKAAGGRISADPEKKIARHEIAAVLDDFVGAAAHLLRLKGRLVLIYSAGRLIEVTTSMRRAGIEPKFLRMVHSSGSSEATLVMIEGVRGGRPGVIVGPPLVIYDRSGRYREEVRRILAGADW